MGLVEGASLLSLIPLLSTVGIDTGSGLAPVSAAFVRVLDWVGLKPGLLAALGLFVFLQVTLAGLAWVHARVALTLQHHLVDQIRAELRNDLDRMEWRQLQALSRGSITNALTTEADRTGAATFLLLTLASGLVVLVAQIALAFRVAPALTAIVLAIAVLAIGVLRPWTRRSAAIGVEMAERMVGMHEATEQWLAGSRQARFYGTHPFGHDPQILTTQVQSIRVRSTSRFLFDTIAVLALATTTYLALVPFAMELGAFLLLLYLFARILPRIKQSHQHYQAHIAVTPAWHSLQDTWMLAKNAAEVVADGEAPRFEQQIRLLDVHVHYGEVRALQGVHLVLERGEKIAITGPNGAGKTTLIEVLLGLVQPDAGHVEIDGHTLTDRAAWRQSIALVPQQPVFLAGTVRTNMAWGAPQATDQDFQEALDRAGCDFLATRQGLDTELGQHAQALSGGQAQRIALAMALARRPRLLVLDEPTSNWDQEGEEAFQEILHSLSGVTVVVVSHRDSTVRSVDRVVALRDGQIYDPEPNSEA